MTVYKYVAVYVYRKTNFKLFSDRFDDNVCVYIKVDTNADNVQVIICTDKVICTS